MTSPVRLVEALPYSSLLHPLKAANWHRIRPKARTLGRFIWPRIGFGDYWRMARFR
jgi:hypothetical protein